MKNVDRSSATYHSVTVNDITVVVTEFKAKVKKEKKPKKTKEVNGNGTNASNTANNGPEVVAKEEEVNGNS